MSRLTRLLLPVVVVLLASSWMVPTWTASTANQSTERCLERLPDVEMETIGLFVEPDDSYAPVIDEIDAARCDINLSMYLISDQVVMDSLASADRRGVRVRVQIEEDPYGGGWSSTDDATAWMQTHDIEWRYAPDRFVFSHAKYMVIDQQVAIVMNQNLTSSAFNGNREFGIVTTEPDIVSEALEVFERDWSDIELLEPPEFVVTSPENSRLTMMQLITSASRSIDMYAEVIRDESFIALLIDAERRGVAVRLIVNQTSDPEDNEINRRLERGGVEIRFGGTLYIHSKAMTFDDQVVFIGSQNPTSNSFDNNRELGILVDDPSVLVRMVGIFAIDWAHSATASPERASPGDILY